MTTAYKGTDGALRYRVGEFSEPLDVLWALIHENKINVYDIPVSELTEQFLNWLDQAAEADLQDLSDFYRWASKLLLIKSRMMLPVEVQLDDDEYEDPRADLVERLIEYQKFKKLSSLLEQQEEESEWSFERKQIHRVVPKEENLWEQIDTHSLLEEMQRLFKGMVKAYSDEKILNMYEEISVNEKITLMTEFLETKGECYFTDLIVRQGNILDMICAFLAVLEAVKFKLASIYQNRLFGNIKICRCSTAA